MTSGISVKPIGGKRFVPKPEHVVKCDIHGIVTTWGVLSDIQKLAASEGIDTVADGPCIFEPNHKQG